MRDLLLQCAGVGAIIVALIHGILGEAKVFPRATIEPARLRTLSRLDRLRCAAGRDALDGLRHGAPLDRAHHDLRVRLLRLRQRMGDAWSSLRLDGAQCGRGVGGGRLLSAARKACRPTREA